MVVRDKIRSGILTNSAAAAVSRLIVASSALLVTPFVLAHLKIEGYGVWETLTAVSIWALVLEGGIGSAVLRYVAHAYANDDRKQIGRTVSLGMMSIFFMASVFTPLVWMGRFVLIAPFHVPAQFATQAAFVFPIMVVSLFAQGINVCLLAVVSGKQMTGVTSMVNAAWTIVGYLVVIGFLFAGYGLTSMVYGQIVNAVGTFLTALVLAQRICPGIRYSFAIPSREELHRLYGYGAYLTVTRIADLSGQQADRLILAYFLDVTWVGYYGIAARLSRLIMEFTSFVYPTIVPAAASMEVTGDRQGIIRLHSDILLGLSCATVCIALLIGGLHDRLELVWLGYYMPQTTPLIFGLVVAGMINMTTAPGTAICRGVGLPGYETIYTAVYGGLKVVLTVIFLKTIGPLGTVAATVISLSLASLLFLVLAHKKLDLDVWSTLRGFRILFIGTLVMGGLFFASRQIGMGSSWLSNTIMLASFYATGLLVFAGALLLFIFPAGFARSLVQKVWMIRTKSFANAETSHG